MSPADDDLAFASATEQARSVRDRDVSARELVELYLERIERLDGAIGSYVEVLDEQARSAAAAADERTADGTADGPLHGVPVSIKDLSFLAGAKTTLGTRSFADNVAAFTDHNVARLVDAGAIALGKTNVPEFGSVGHTDTQLLGPCSTPWDLSRNAGGSSGGAGASLAAGLCALAHGSDGAGSIRIPASINGLVGLKPSRDRISAGPMAGDSAFGLSTAGALTRSVADAALALDVMAGYELGDPGMAPPPQRAWSDEVGADVGQLRLGVCRQAPFSPDGIHPAVSAGIDATVALLEQAGHSVEEVELPLSDDFPELLLTIWSAGLASQPFDPSTYEVVNQWFVKIGQERRAADYAAAQFQLQLQSRRLVEGMHHLDAVVMPVLTQPSHPNGYYLDWEGEAIFYDQTALVGLTPIANLTGQPSITLPLHHDASIGPVGLQLLGRPWDEAGLVRLAAQLEQAAPWTDRRPSLTG